MIFVAEEYMPVTSFCLICLFVNYVEGYLSDYIRLIYDQILSTNWKFLPNLIHQAPSFYTYIHDVVSNIYQMIVLVKKNMWAYDKRSTKKDVEMIITDVITALNIFTNNKPIVNETLILFCLNYTRIFKKNLHTYKAWYILREMFNAILKLLKKSCCVYSPNIK